MTLLATGDTDMQDADYALTMFSGVFDCAELW
jgi:hypothetical protein